MKYPVKVQAVRISKLGEFLAGERVINSDAELDEFKREFSRYTVRLKVRRKRRPRIVSFFYHYWWVIPVCLIGLAIAAKIFGFFR